MSKSRLLTLVILAVLVVAGYYNKDVLVNKLNDYGLCFWCTESSDSMINMDAVKDTVKDAMNDAKESMDKKVDEMMDSQDSQDSMDDSKADQ